MTDKLKKNLRHLLVEKDNFAEKLCCLGSTSQCESNHARIINRGYHVKGNYILTLDWPRFDLDLTLTWPWLSISGDPINIESNQFEAKLGLGSIIQNAGFSGIRDLSQNTNPENTAALLKTDENRTRRSRDNMDEVKKQKVQKLKKQKQYSSSTTGLSTYKGGKGNDDKNTAPSKTFLCTKAKSLSLDK